MVATAQSTSTEVTNRLTMNRQISPSIASSSRSDDRPANRIGGFHHAGRTLWFLRCSQRLASTGPTPVKSSMRSLTANMVTPRSR